MTTERKPRPRAALVFCTALLATVVVLLCLIPKAENDLFFILRIGTDIVTRERVPHFDTYSWTNYGTSWALPEWLAFVLYALAFRAGGFFGTWALMVCLTLAMALTVWWWLLRRLRPAWAFPLAALMLLALSDCLQERPYAFTYPLLAVGVVLLMRAHAGRPRLLLWLPPLCVVWTNLHQGFLALVGLLLAYALGDALSALWLKIQAARVVPDLTLPPEARAVDTTERRRLTARAAWMLATACACALAGMISPYGWRVYWNVFITLRNHTLMANVTEWNPATVLPLAQLQPFLLLTAVAVLALTLSRRRNLGDALALAALFGQALLHARSIPLFAIAGLVIIAPHFGYAVRAVRRRLRLSVRPAARGLLLAACALVFVAMLALVCVANLRRAVGPLGYSAEGIGEAVARVPSFPHAACAFMDAARFPTDLRLLNDFETGGYLMWRRPAQRVFVDGRLDVYAGRTFDDMLTLSRDSGTSAWTALVRRYDFDCVLTTDTRQAEAFAADSQWQLVYTDLKNARKPRCRILLRRRPEFAALIARCQDVIRGKLKA
ncbi:MAG: hypothetical protein M3Y28_11115 [Armatimonadota bacterium]|nr:hypothetical protein [Armatimonadota bacterium]